MTTMIAEIYDALIDAGASEEKSRKAAEAVATYDNQMALIGTRLGMLRTATQIVSGAVVLILISQVALWSEMGKIDGHLTQIGSQINHIEQMLSAGKP